MRYSSIHTHTVFCDGADDVETMCRAAFAKGLLSIGFSAHAPVTGKAGIRTGWHLPDGDLERYLDEVRAAKRRWEGRLPVYLGLEADYIRGLAGPPDWDIQALGIDYLIASVHFVVPPRGAPFAVDGSPEEVERGIREGFSGDGEALAACYRETVAEMIRAGGFDILGHADLVKKNNFRLRFFDPGGNPSVRGLAEIARLAGEAGIVTEVNTGGINRKWINETYPSPAFLRQFREQGVPVIITADAHRAEDLDGNYDEARRTLLAAGYTEHHLFQGRKAGKAVWRTGALTGA
ncbi:MAG: histidinol-phosphatase [Treponema sp.]|jgi:histidinol-phosphatase (PHP family)|nr:histidinol-phosphatase [Treponema sp.]